ncbi:MAG: TetR family transcriptional regulator [Acidimicrobiia bacterium]|nr:TetR family transcriptional regulator [Acidimicrobiia bacterium]
MSPRRRSPEATEVLRRELVQVAHAIVEREGPSGLTMRSLAAEAGCAIGLPYKVFTDRTELVAEVIAAEFDRLRAQFDALVADAGSRTVGANLARWSQLLLGSPVVGLAHEAGDDPRLADAIDAAAGESGVIGALELTVSAYLAAEKGLGRIAPTVDERTFGFLIAGAVHNLLVAGSAYPRPTKRQLEGMLRTVAETLARRPEA